jgi:hypothetical protein
MEKLRSVVTSSDKIEVLITQMEKLRFMLVIVVGVITQLSAHRYKRSSFSPFLSSLCSCALHKLLTP